MAISFNRPSVPGVLPDQPVPGEVVVTPRIYWDETKTRLLAEGHPDARFLAYAEGTVIPAVLAHQAGLTEFLQPVVEPADPVVVEPAPAEPVSTTKRTRARADRQTAPGVVADTSIDGEAHVLVPEPGSPLRNGVDK